MATDWKEIILQSREAEVGVTDLGKQILNIEAKGHGCVVRDGVIVDFETGEPAEREIFNQIWKDARTQMRVTSQTGKELLEKV